MSVTGEDIVAAHGHIACGIREPRTAGNSEPAGNSRFPLPLPPGDRAHPDGY